MTETLIDFTNIEEDRAFRPFSPEMFDIEDEQGFEEAVTEMEANPMWWSRPNWMT